MYRLASPGSHVAGAGLYNITGADPSAQGGPQLVEQPLNDAREFMLGFGPTPLAANVTTIFTAQPQLPFRPSRLVVPSSIVQTMQVNDIKVGKNSQLLSSNPVPAAPFSELAVGVALGLDTCNVGQQITLSINSFVAQNFFMAALIGTAMQ
jgi:hypothetical protein